MVIGGLREKVMEDLEEAKHQLSPEFALRRGYLNTKTRVKMTSMLKHGGSMVYQMDGVER